MRVSLRRRELQRERVADLGLAVNNSELRAAVGDALSRLRSSSALSSSST
jgi:hypothetical protein